MFSVVGLFAIAGLIACIFSIAGKCPLWVPVVFMAIALVVLTAAGSAVAFR